jgi:hypothetical protein
MGKSSSVPTRNKPKPSRLRASRGRTIDFEFSKKGKTTMKIKTGVKAGPEIIITPIGG